MIKWKKDNLPPGFPWKGKFRTKEEVEAYFATDKIECLLCGKWFKVIGGAHLIRAHGITGDEYKEMFGLPWSRGLVGKLSREKSSVRMKGEWADGKMVNTREKLKRMRPGAARPFQPFHRDFLSKSMAAYQASRRVYQREDFEAILDRMREQQRIIGEVCEDADMPSFNMVREYLMKNPEFAEKIKQTVYSLPYSLQMKSRKASPQK